MLRKSRHSNLKVRLLLPETQSFWYRLYTRSNNGQTMYHDEISAYVFTYNEEKNIAGCIESIKANGINDIFIIDASTDKTAEVAESCGAIVIKEEKNKCKQMQRAIDHCTTPLIFIMAADDKIESDCIEKLYNDLKSGDYDAVQAGRRVMNPSTYWQKGADANMKHCLSFVGPTKMIGGDTLYKADTLKSVGMDTSFKTGHDDTTLSIRMEKAGASMAGGTGVVLVGVPGTFKGTLEKWKRYGTNDGRLFLKYKDKRKNVLKHLLYVYPIKRSLKLIKNGSGLYIGFTIGQGWFRFIYMMKYLIFNREKE